MADDDWRVESRKTLAGRGNATTPERIAEIQRRAEEVEKLGRGKPLKSFAEVMDESGVEPDGGDELSDKEKRRRALPNKGPRPGLVHPSQRDVYRDDEADDSIVLKG